jgi:hypothetical protein
MRQVPATHVPRVLSWPLLEIVKNPPMEVSAGNAPLPIDVSPALLLMMRLPVMVVSFVKILEPDGLSESKVVML